MTYYAYMKGSVSENVQVIMRSTKPLPYRNGAIACIDYLGDSIVMHVIAIYPKHRRKHSKKNKPL